MALEAIGKILNAHGVKGEVIFEHRLSGTIHFEDWDALMIELLPESRIPFFIEKIKTQGASTCIVKLEEINSPEAAQEIVQKNVYPSPNVSIQEKEISNPVESLIGYTLFDKDKMIGKIDNILNPNTNPLFIINDGAENELLIPANEELIIEIKKEAREIIVNVPDGLL